jgi:hypothetical protein
MTAFTRAASVSGTWDRSDDVDRPWPKVRIAGPSGYRRPGRDTQAGGGGDMGTLIGTRHKVGDRRGGEHPDPGAGQAELAGQFGQMLDGVHPYVVAGHLRVQHPLAQADPAPDHPARDHPVPRPRPPASHWQPVPTLVPPHHRNLHPRRLPVTHPAAPPPRRPVSLRSAAPPRSAAPSRRIFPEMALGQQWRITLCGVVRRLPQTPNHHKVKAAWASQSGEPAAA